jgi:hypothetical protein
VARETQEAIETEERARVACEAQENAERERVAVGESTFASTAFAVASTPTVIETQRPLQAEPKLVAESIVPPQAVAEKSEPVHAVQAAPSMDPALGLILPTIVSEHLVSDGREKWFCGSCTVGNLPDADACYLCETSRPRPSCR